MAVALAGAAWTLWERSQHDPWLRLLERVRASAWTAPESSCRPTAPPRQIATAVTTRFGERASALADWLLKLETQRYARSPAVQPEALCSANSNNLPGPPDVPTPAHLPPLLLAAAACTARRRAKSPGRSSTTERNGQRGVPYAGNEEAMRWADEVAAAPRPGPRLGARSRRPGAAPAGRGRG